MYTMHFPPFPMPIRQSITRRIATQRTFSLHTIPMPFMSLSVPDESISWNRVLPKPTTLLHDHFNDPFPRRDSSLLHHYITSDKSYRPASDDGSQRRLTVPSIAYSEVSRFDQPPLLSPVRNSNDPASAIYVKEGFISNKRTASLMEHETESREPSPSAQNQSEESGNHFCLCQPDPKIPRPRNGRHLSFLCWL